MAIKIVQNGPKMSMIWVMFGHEYVLIGDLTFLVVTLTIMIWAIFDGGINGVGC
jgi:hypothetical protein